MLSNVIIAGIENKNRLNRIDSLREKKYEKIL